MTLFVDYRQGSHELVAPLKKMGLPVEETRLDSADIAFAGRGLKGQTIQIGIEHKKLGELITALRTERLQGHQLLKMQKAYTFSYLLIEGTVLVNSMGYLIKAGKYGRPPTLLGGSMTESELEKRLATLHRCAGLMPMWAENQRRSCAIIAAWYRTFTDRDLDAHTSHIAIYRPPSLVPISEFRIFMQSLDGISFKTSKAIERHFKGSIKAAVNAPRSEWLDIEGIGVKLATAITDTFGK